MGEPTFGKGLIQTIVELSDGSAVVVTVARYQVCLPQHADSAAGLRCAFQSAKRSAAFSPAGFVLLCMSKASCPLFPHVACHHSSILLINSPAVHMLRQHPLLMKGRVQLQTFTAVDSLALHACADARRHRHQQGWHLTRHPPGCQQHAAPGWGRFLSLCKRAQRPAHVC